MNRKTLLKSIIGTVVIYGVLLAFLFIFRNIIDFLVYLPVLIGAFVACSIAAGLLFKGKIYAWVWTAASAIFYAVFWLHPAGERKFEFILLWSVIVLAPLLIPFFIVKSIFISITLQEQEGARGK